MSSSAGVGPLSASVVVGLLLACPISAHAFSPVFTRHYVRAAGPPVVVADVFSVCDPGGAFRLIVENGPAHEGRISSGSIVLNGLEVVGENDFNAQVARIERPLHHIVQDNRLEVRLVNASPTFALNESTHALINERAARYSEFDASVASMKMPTSASFAISTIRSNPGRPRV